MVFILALIGMICWGIAPIFVKIGLKDISPLMGLWIRTIITSLLISSWMAIGGTFSNIKNISTSTFLLLAIEAILATLVGDLAYFAAVKRGSASVVTLIMSTSPLVTMIMSVIFLNEQITVWRIVGAGLITLGVVLII